MGIEADVQALQQVPLFSGFSAEQLRLVAFGTERLSMGKGRELYREGDEADCGFLILSGVVSLYEDRDGSRRIVETARPGTLLGEFALIAPTQRPTGAVTSEDCEVMRISRTLVRRVLEEYPDIAVRLHQQLSGNFETMLGKITGLASKFAD
jgi:CRP-like cAMP-binding protein